MTDTSHAADPTALPSGDCPKAGIPTHLTGPLRNYFSVAEHAAIPERLSLLVERFEASLVASGERLGATFRDDLLQAHRTRTTSWRSGPL